jgi:hypothetical protein
MSDLTAVDREIGRRETLRSGLTRRVLRGFKENP